MQYDALAWGLVLMALLVAFCAARLLFNLQWIRGWLRGSAGLGLLALATLVLLLAWNLRSYDPLPFGRPLATLSFSQLSPQRFSVTVLEGGRERHLELDGDLWHLDAQILEWRGLAQVLGLTPSYRLQALGGRYKSLELRSKERQVSLIDDLLGVDLWHWLHHGQHDLFTFNPKIAQVNYQPMADQAAFSVYYGPGGLTVEPINPMAIEALNNW